MSTPRIPTAAPLAHRCRPGIGKSNSAAGSILFVSGLALLAGCGPELTPRTRVDSLRILAIQSDPPEAQPGETVAVRALIADPLGEARALDWTLSLCTPDESESGCFEYSALLEVSPTEEEANQAYAACCVRGGSSAAVEGVLELGGAFTRLTTSDQMLLGLDEITARQGINAQLNLLTCVSGVCVSETPTPGEELDPASVGISLPQDQSALALKRVRVSSSALEDQNGNPELQGLRVDEGLYLESQRAVLVAGHTYTLEPSLSEASVECYTALYSDGREERMLESPYFSFYATAGEFDSYFTEPAYTTDCATTVPIEKRLEDARNDFTVPPLEALLSPELTLWVVVWDRRGGIDWLTLHADVVGE